MDAPLAIEFSETPFSARFLPCARKPLSWKEELEKIAFSMVNDAGSRPIFVCSSGGIDSEIVCRTLFALGIHFTVLTVEHAAGTNEADIAYARAWCRDHGIKQHIVRLDMPDFFKNGIERYAAEGYVSDNVFRYFQLFLFEVVESMGGYAVLGGGEQLYQIPSYDKAHEGDTYIEFESGFTASLQWMKKSGIPHRPYFFYGTPEAALAYLQLPTVDFVVRHPDIFAHPGNKYLFKRLICHSIWPDMVARPKMSGYERIFELRMKTQEKLRDRFDAKLETFRLPVIQMREQLTQAIR